MTCMHRLSKLHFTAEQWALAKEYSQCKECDTAAESRRRKREKEKRRERLSSGSSRHANDRVITRHVWQHVSKRARGYIEGEEGEVIEEVVDRDEIMIDDDDDEAEMQTTSASSKRAQHPSLSLQRKHADKPNKFKRRTSSALAADGIDDGAQTEVDDDTQHRRRRRQQHKDDDTEAAQGAAQPRKRRRRRSANDNKKKKKRKYNLAPEINPYNRNFTAQQLTQSRTGRLGTAADANTPPPPPLQPDLIAFLRSAFGLDGVDHASSTQVSSVFAKYMEQTGTLGNGKVYVAVSSVNTLDTTVGSSDEERANVRRTRQREKQEIAQKGKKASDQWQPMLGLFAGRDIEKDEVVTTYGGVLVDGDDARRRHASTYTHIRRIRDSRMVRDGRLFSALFDRSQVDMYDQFSMDGKRKSRKRLLPACGAEHVVTALSMEGHEDEMRVGLILLDALQGEKGALYGQRMEAKEQQALLARIMAHIGDQSTVISGEALKQIDGKRYLSRVRGPALIINEPSATFYSSSPNPYSSRSGDTSTEGEQVFRDKSLDISYLFPFTLRPLLRPPLLLHPLPEQRHKALRELSQNLSDSARTLLAATCHRVHELLYTTGMGFMANTGSKRECNVRVIEVNPRRDGLAPNEIFYVSCRKILKGEEILAPYNNNESKSKRMARVKEKKKEEEEEEEEDDGGEGQEAEQQDKEEDGAAEKMEDDDKTAADYAKLTGTQKARLRRREAMERKQKKRELLRLRALQRSARAQGKAAAELAEAAEDGEDEEMDELEERKDGERRTSNRTAASGATKNAVEEVDEYEFPGTDAMELLSPSSSSPSPSPSCSVSPSPIPSAFTSTSPAPSFSPVPPPAALPMKANKVAASPLKAAFNGLASMIGAAVRGASKEKDKGKGEKTDSEKEKKQQQAEAEEAEREKERAIERKKQRERKRREKAEAAAAAPMDSDKRADKVEVIDIDAEDDDEAGNAEMAVADGENEDDEEDEDDPDNPKGFSILRRQDSPWMPPVIFEQRTRARSAFGGELQPAGDGVKVVVSFTQMQQQQREFERMQGRKPSKMRTG